MTELSVQPGSKSAVVAHHVDVENQHDMDAMLATLVDENPIRDEVTGKAYRGVEAVAGRYAELWKAFPDFTATITQLIEKDDDVVMAADFTGTHRGVYKGHEPTDRAFKVRLVNIFHFEGDKIASETIYFDLSSQLRQLGLLDKWDFD